LNASYTYSSWHGVLHLIGFVVLALASLLAPVATAVASRANGTGS
jgi:hypothetical protein